MLSFGLVKLHDTSDPLNWYARLKFRQGNKPVPRDPAISQFNNYDHTLEQVAQKSQLYQHFDPSILRLAKVSDGSHAKAVVEKRKIAFNAKQIHEIKHASAIHDNGDLGTGDDDAESVVSASVAGSLDAYNDQSDVSSTVSGREKGDPKAYKKLKARANNAKRDHKKAIAARNGVAKHVKSHPQNNGALKAAHDVVQAAASVKAKSLKALKRSDVRTTLSRYLKPGDTPAPPASAHPPATQTESST